MDSGEVEKKKHTKGIIVLVVFLALVIGAVILFMNLFRENTTYTSGGTKENKSISLSCNTKSNNVDGAFFDFSSAETVSQDIKAIFKGDKIDNIYYGAEAKYANAKVAKDSEAKNNAKYGLFMQENGKQISDFSPNFSVSDTGVNINLFADIEQLNSDLVKIFMIDTADNDFKNYSLSTLSAFYKSKGFTCKTIN